MSTQPFLKNQWYVAARMGEIGETPLARTVCDEPLVMFRGPDGKAGILSDRCPHRKAPLSRGHVVNGEMQCGYHGLRFNREGVCTHIPGDLAIPANFAARSFPCIERDGFVFVWMGAGAADPGLLPDFHENGGPAWTAVPGYLHIKGHYQLMVDNILDLTHVVFVHKTTLAGGGVTETPLEVEVKGDRVFARRMMFNVDTAPIYKAAKGLHGKIDRWQIFEFQPPMFVKITLGARAAGSDEPLAEPTHVVLNSFTPETEKTSHYFWSTARPWALDDPGTSEIYRTMSDLAFAEDAAIVEQQQKLIDSDRSGAPLTALPFDRAGFGARRIVKRLLAEEAAQGEARAAAE